MSAGDGLRDSAERLPAGEVELKAYYLKSAEEVDAYERRLWKEYDDRLVAEEQADRAFAEDIGITYAQYLAVAGRVSEPYELELSDYRKDW